MPDLNACRNSLDEAEHLAVLLVDQIAVIDLVDHAGDDLAVHLTEYVTRPASRDAVKRVVERLARRIRADKAALMLVSPDPVDAAARLCTAAVKSFAVASARADWLRSRLLVIKFTSIDAPWVEDPPAGVAVHAVPSLIEQ